MSTNMNTNAPINPIEEMFDGFVARERKIGLAVDLYTCYYPQLSPTVDGNPLEGSMEYHTAMQRRLARLLNNRLGKDRLHWESASFAMDMRTTGTGTKNVRSIAMHVPITEDRICRCECGQRDHECVSFRNELTVVFAFDLEPTGPAKFDGYRSTQGRDGRVVLNRCISDDDCYAWLRAYERTQEIDWTWCGQNALDLHALWLHAFDSLVSIATETVELRD